MIVQRISRSLLVTAVVVSSACGGTTTDEATSESTSGGSVPPVPSITATAAPTEESPGVYTGVVTCNQPNTISFDGAASEVVSLEATFTTTEGSGNPSVTVFDGAEPVMESGNPLAISGAVYPDAPVNARRTYNFRRSAGYSLRVESDNCGLYRYRVALTRDVAPSANLTRETAEPIAVGTASRGTLGCEEHRFYSLDVPRRTTFHVTLAGAGRIAEGGGDVAVSLLGADGSPVMASGNPVAAGGMLTNPPGAPTTRDITASRAGRYILDVSFANGCTIADYELTLAR